MYCGRDQSTALGALLLVGSVATVPAGFFFPSLAWIAAAALLGIASLLIHLVGIGRFVAICSVTVAHFFVVGPPPPYGRGDLPLDYLMLCVVLPLTLAAGSIGIWHWRDPAQH
jgi:hypothetical protein